jgi:hypothetical protein
MLSRALSLATVTLLIGFCAAERVQAQENLEAGKSPSQIFADTCTACHKGSRGLLKTVAPGSLPSFLRQHYTTSPAMAGVLASYLISNGATDTRISGGQSKGAKEGAKEAKQEARRDQKPAEQLDRFGRRLHPATASQETRPEADPRQEPKQAARPENEGPQGHKRLARPAEPPDGARPDIDGQVPAQAQVAGERGPDGPKLSAKQRLSKRGKPGIEEPPKVVEEPLINEPTKSEGATKEEGKPEEAKPVGETPSQSAKVESGGETSTLRSDPVSPVTPAPPATTPPAVSAVSVSGGSEPAAAPAVSSPPGAVTAASAPPLPPMAPAGPPAPPISQ